MDPWVARSTVRWSARHVTQFFPGPPDPRFSPPVIVANIAWLVSHSLFVRCTPPAKRRRRFRAVVLTLSHCALLRALSVRLEVVDALSALEANESQEGEEGAVFRWEQSEVFVAESPRHTPVLQQSLHHPGLCHAHMRTFRVNGAVAISYMQLSLKPSINVRQNAGAFVDKVAQVSLKLHRLSVPLADCFDDER